MGKLMDCLNIPLGVRDKIYEHCNHGDEQQQRDECIHYYRKYSPYPLWGWGYLGGQLQHRGEEVALTAVRAYIQKAPGTSVGVAYVCIGMLEDACDHVYMIHSKLKPAVNYV